MNDDFINCMISEGYTFFTSVPCSLLAPLLRQIDTVVMTHNITHISALREDIAVGLASGALLAGRKSAVLMQNSGLGVSVNALASLVIPFKIPLILIISMRGYGGEDTLENLEMGRMTEVILNQMQIPFRYIHTSYNRNKELLLWATRVTGSGHVVALLILPTKNDL